MRRIMLVPLVALVGFLGAACEETDTADPAPLDAFADVTTIPAFVPADQITSCVDATKYGAFVGDAEASARWNAAGQSDAALAEACTQIGRANPTALATMHWNWTAAQASTTTTPPVPVATPPHECDPSYPELCLPLDGPELNCAEITERRFTVLPPDRHGFDRNHDGIGCEAD